MPTYKCWHPEEDDSGPSARMVNASCHEEAATLWAEAENRCHDYIAEDGRVDVMVTGPAGLARVPVEAEIKYDFSAGMLQWIKKEGW